MPILPSALRPLLSFVLFLCVVFPLSPRMCTAADGGHRTGFMYRRKPEGEAVEGGLPRAFRCEADRCPVGAFPECARVLRDGR